MTNHTPRRPAPTDTAPTHIGPTHIGPTDTGPRTPAARDLVQTPSAFDANGFDPNDFEWRPVPRRPRADGWTPDVQRRFIEALAETGLVSAACERVDMSVQSAYRLRRADDAAGFACAWDAAVAAAAARLVDVAFTRAIEGVDMPVFDRDGRQIGARRQYSDRLLMFLLRAYQPDRFRHATHDTRGLDQAPPPLPVPVTQALSALGPVTPDAPHRLMSPERLEDAIDTAHALAQVDAIYPRDDRERYVHPHHAPRANNAAQTRHRGGADDWETYVDKPALD